MSKSNSITLALVFFIPFLIKFNINSIQLEKVNIETVQKYINVCNDLYGDCYTKTYIPIKIKDINGKVVGFGNYFVKHTLNTNVFNNIYGKNNISNFIELHMVEYAISNIFNHN